MFCRYLEDVLPKQDNSKTILRCLEDVLYRLGKDVLGGIEAAVNLGWSSRNNTLFHVGDVPQH